VKTGVGRVSGNNNCFTPVSQRRAYVRASVELFVARVRVGESRAVSGNDPEE